MGERRVCVHMDAVIRRFSYRTQSEVVYDTSECDDPQHCTIVHYLYKSFVVNFVAVRFLHAAD